MPEFEQHGWQGFWMPGRRVDGQHGVVVVIKRRFEVDMAEAICRPAVTPPVALMQEPFDDGEPPMVSYRAPSEIAIEKPKIDLIVRGTAHAPRAEPTPQFDVEFRLANVVSRRLRVFGDRHLIWYPPVKWLTAADRMKGEDWIWPDPDFSEPEPIVKLPLRYEYAFGGWAKILLTADVQDAANEAQAVGAVIEERRKKKKEILDQLKKEEAGAAAPPAAPPKDAKAAALAEKAFGAGGGEVALDEETARRLAAEEAADDGLKLASEFRFKDDVAEAAPPAAAAAQEAPPDDPAPEDPNAKFFSGSADEGGTAMLDISALDLRDELQEDLSARAQAEARRLEDDEGTLRDRATEFGDIQLYSDSWAAKYMRARPAAKKRKVEESEIPTMPYPTNLCGRGFVVSHLEEAVQGVQLPNIEDPDDLLSAEDYVADLATFSLDKLRTPAGWATYPMGAYPRARYFGTYPWDLDAAKAAMEAAQADLDEDDPDDKPILGVFKNTEIPLMNPLAFQEAHPSLQVDEVRGDEDVYFTNLTPEGRLYFKLPGVHPTVTIDMSEGPEYLPVHIDQLLFDLDEPAAPAVEILWRGFYPLRDYEELGVKMFRRIQILEATQDEWLDQKRKDADKKKSLDDALRDEDGFDERDLETKYRAQFKRERGGKGERLDDVQDAVVFDQTDERQVVYDTWDEKIRDEKEAFIAEQERLAAERAKLRDKILKAKARELADDEFGIIRDPETGEVLAVEPPAPTPKKKG